MGKTQGYDYTFASAADKAQRVRKSALKHSIQREEAYQEIDGLYDDTGNLNLGWF